MLGVIGPTTTRQFRGNKMIALGDEKCIVTAGPSTRV